MIEEELDKVDSHLTSSVNPTGAPRDFAKFDPSLAAAHILPLRVIYPRFVNNSYHESILDSGSEILAMREDIWRSLGVPLSSDKIMGLESANNKSTRTLGVNRSLSIAAAVSPLSSLVVVVVLILSRSSSRVSVAVVIFSESIRQARIAHQSLSIY